ncbi:50S ribosomal protein L25 [candidate division WWE3 bacterium]|uniref:Large ribosomal subunit protein bL25 n=1 Tax=candidate division WWE3 bacterium TaxID=2053526 RepID=A0A955LLE9_UNCKA|nr:50S ribosomal protein L25 [candidate division WWE3 bacterium]
MSRQQLNAQLRELTGKKNRRLRRQGFVPGVVYGPKNEPLNVQVDALEFARFLRGGGDTELLELSIENVDAPRVVLIHDMQLEPVTSEPKHVDFFEVDLSQPVEVEVPLELVGEVIAVEEKRGVLLQIMQDLPIKVLPDNIPPAIEVDLSKIAEVGDTFTVSDLSLAEGIEVMVDNPEEVIIKIDEVKTMQQELEEEEEAQAQAKAALEGEEEDDEEETEDGGSSSEEADES